MIYVGIVLVTLSTVFYYQSNPSLDNPQNSKRISSEVISQNNILAEKYTEDLCSIIKKSDKNLVLSESELRDSTITFKNHRFNYKGIDLISSELIDINSNWKFVLVPSSAGELIFRAGNKTTFGEKFIDGTKKSLHHASLAENKDIYTAGVFKRKNDGSVELEIDSGNYGLNKLNEGSKKDHINRLSKFLAAQDIPHKVVIDQLVLK